RPWLERERVRVARRLERRALVRAPDRARRDLALPQVSRQLADDLRQIRVGPDDRRTFEGPCEITIAAVRRTAFREVEAKIGARRDRLQLALGRRRNHD